MCCALSVELPTGKLINVNYDSNLRRLFAQISALFHDMLDQIGVFDDAIKQLNMQYNALLTSARSEMLNSEKNYQVRVITRIGYVVDEMKDSQSEVVKEIERLTEIIKDSAECLLEAQQTLDTSVSEAGKAINGAAGKLTSDLELLADSTFYPTIATIEYLINQFEVHILRVYAHFNPTINMFMIVFTLRNEIEMYDELFERFVLELYVDMLIVQLVTDMSAQAAFLQLDHGLQAFRDSCDSIKNSLANCESF